MWLLSLSFALAEPLRNVVALQAHGQQFCALTVADERFCWGGELGQEAKQVQAAQWFSNDCTAFEQTLRCPDEQSWPTRISQIRKDERSLCVLGVDKQVRCTGRFARLWGLDPRVEQQQPTIVASDVLALNDNGLLSKGQHHILSTTADRIIDFPTVELVTEDCGLDQQGHTNCFPHKVRLTDLVVDASSTYRFGLGRLSNGQVISIDKDKTTKLPLKTYRASRHSLALSDTEACVITRRGTVTCWGGQPKLALSKDMPQPDDLPQQGPLCEHNTDHILCPPLLTSPTRPVVRWEPVPDDLQQSAHAACFLRDQNLICHGELHGWMFSERQPVASGVTTFSLFEGQLAAISAEGLLQLRREGLVLHEQRGLTDVVQGAHTTCTRGQDEQIWCTDRRDQLLPAPMADLPKQIEGALCDGDQCLLPDPRTLQGDDTPTRRVERAP